MSNPPKQVWVYWDVRAGTAGEWVATTVKPGSYAIGVTGPYECRKRARQQPGDPGEKT
jgi:hypothetical protein